MRKEIFVKSGLGVLGGAALLGGGILADRVFLNPRSAGVDGGAVKTLTPVVTPGAFATATPDGARLAARGDIATPMVLETAVARVVSTAVVEVKPVATVKPAETVAVATPRPTVRAQSTAESLQKVQGKPPFDECAGRPDLDGRVEVQNVADKGGVLRRQPVTLGSRRGILELGIGGGGFEGYDRAIFVIPEGGHTWTLNVREKGALTERLYGFCGPIDAVTKWAFRAHIDSLVQASRRWDGQEPAKSELTLGVFKFEGDNTNPPAATLTELQKGRLEILAWVNQFDLTFVDTDGKRAGQPIRGVPLK